MEGALRPSGTWDLRFDRALPPSACPMPKIVDHDAMREKVLARSSELFASKGFAAVTMRGIAREAGVSTGTLYHYFETKEQLFARLVERAASQDIREALATLPADADPLARIDSFLSFVRVAESRLQEFLLLTLDYVRHVDAPSDVIVSALRAYRQTIEEHLTELPPAFAVLVLDAVIGRLVQRLIDPQLPFDDAPAEMLRTLAGALAAGAPEA